MDSVEISNKLFDENAQLLKIKSLMSYLINDFERLYEKHKGNDDFLRMQDLVFCIDDMIRSTEKNISVLVDEV